VDGEKTVKASVPCRGFENLSPFFNFFCVFGSSFLTVDHGLVPARLKMHLFNLLKKCIYFKNKI